MTTTTQTIEDRIEGKQGSFLKVALLVATMNNTKHTQSASKPV